ncbi:MAG TPA: diacylglycerol kinase family protein [Stenomitos sp.]
MAVFIVNPRSANGATGARWPALERYLRDRGLAGETCYTTGPGDARRFAAEALRAGARLVVAVGGDGTINEVVNGFFDAGHPADSELGILPCGTGGDLIRTLGIARDPYRAAEHLRQGKARRIDVGRARFRADGETVERHFLNIAEAGLGGAVVDRVNRTSKAFGGFVSFLVGTLATFATYQPAEITLTVEGGVPQRLRAWNVVVGNGRYFGGGMRILPGAEPDDGLFDVMVVGDVPRRALFANVVALYRGTHLHQAGVQHFRAREVTVEAARPLLLDLDGEQPGTSPVTFQLLPGVLNVRL